MKTTHDGPAAADSRLAAFLQKKGAVTSERLAAARKAASGRSLPEVLHVEHVVDESELARLLARELRLPKLNLPALTIEPETARLVDESIARRNQVLPVRREGKTIVLAMANPFDFEIVRHIEFLTSLQVRPAIAVRSQLVDAIEHQWRLGANLDEILARVPDATPVAAPAASAEVKELERSIDEAPVVKMVHLLLARAMQNRASDVHVEPGPNATLVRYRINGVLEDAFQIPKWVHGPVVARIKVMSRLDITERRVPQDGGMRIRFENRLVDFRVSSLPTNYGEKLVMRILDPTVALRRLEDVGLSARDSAVLREAIRKPEGMILVTGPTGSGKTTTLYAVIREILSPGVNIVTIENPIEYEVQGVSQVQIQPKQGMTFAAALRSILRQDPDVILVGEIRDRETAQVAFQAAQTGHLVLSTLHTNDTVSTITRLIDLGIEPYLAASSLLAVLAQRLVRINCAACAAPLELRDEERSALGLSRSGTYRRGTGCRECRDTGFAARAGVFEILRVSDDLQRLVESRAPEATLRQAARKEGMTTLFEDAVAKIEAGLTTPEEALRVVEAERVNPRCPRCQHELEDGFVVCPECLYRLRRTCRACGSALEDPEWRRCPYCGEAADESPEERAEAVESPNVVVLDTPALEGDETWDVDTPTGNGAADLPSLDGEPDSTAPASPDAAIPAADASSPGGERRAVAPGVAAGEKPPAPAGADASPLRETRPVGRVPAGAPPLDTPRVLVVDDNEDLRAVVKRMLESGPVPMQVVEASNGLEALGVLKLAPPHLVILDLMMPRMDGFDLCRRLRADVETAFLPIMMLTAREDPEARIDGFRAGTDDYLVKPVDRRELHLRVLRLLERTYGFRPPEPLLEGCARN